MKNKIFHKNKVEDIVLENKTIKYKYLSEGRWYNKEQSVWYFFCKLHNKWQSIKAYTLTTTFYTDNNCFIK